MCGILFSSDRESNHSVCDRLLECIRRRGPDHVGHIVVNHSNGFCSFVSSLLSLRGKSLVTQPLRDPQTGSILCWNGEAWKIDDTLIAENDAQTVFDSLLQAVSKDPSQGIDGQERLDDAVVRLFSRLSGPYAFIFYNARHGSVYYGRDRLGRRSLLKSNTREGGITVSSVCSGPTTASWAEVEADGIYVIHLGNTSESTGIVERRITWPETKDPHDSVSITTEDLFWYKILLLTSTAEFFSIQLAAIRLGGSSTQPCYASCEWTLGELAKRFDNPGP